MKRFLLLCLCVLAACLPGLTNAADVVADGKLFSSTAPSGTSYWVADLTKASWESLGVQIVGDITEGVAGSGTTLTVLFAATNEKPTALQIAGTSPFPVLGWQYAFRALDLTSGNSRWVYPMDPGACRYLAVKAVSGVTNLTFNLELVGRSGAWQRQDGDYISSQSFTVSSVSGVSTLTVPDGTRKATGMPLSNGIRYTYTGTPGSSSKRVTAQGLISLSAEEARRFRFNGDAAADTTFVVDYFTR